MSGFSSRNDAQEKRMRNSRHSWLGFGTESAPSVRRPADDLPHSREPEDLSGRRRRPAGLASVRRSNGSYGFPVSRFHKGVSSKVQGRNQRDQFDKPVLAVQPTLGQAFPARVAPALVAMRPQPPHDPTVKLVEEPAHMGLAVVLAHPRMTGLSSSINPCVLTGALRRVRRRIWSLKCRMDFPRGNAYRIPPRTPLLIIEPCSLRGRLPCLIL